MQVPGNPKVLPRDAKRHEQQIGPRGRDPRLPARLRGRCCEKMVLGIDVAPTMLAIAGVDVPERMQGRDLGPLLRGDEKGRREDWYYEHTYANPPRHRIPRCEGVRTERWKYARYTDFNPPHEQLFDLSADPSELRDIGDEQATAEVLARLRARCDEYRASLEQIRSIVGQAFGLTARFRGSARPACQAGFL